MIFSLFNSDYQLVSIIDQFESVIWTLRYQSYGDFELILNNNNNNIEVGYYVMNDRDNSIMIIENLRISINSDGLNTIQISGRSLESILLRRIIWPGMTWTNKPIQTIVSDIIRDSFSNPSVTNRKISNFTFDETTSNELSIGNLSVQYTGDNVYDVIKDLCGRYAIGFCILLDPYNENPTFKLQLYSGEDRSYQQTERSYVVFSKSFENLLNGDYKENRTYECNTALVAGEDSGSNRKFVYLEGSVGNVGLHRKELYVDARDIQSETSSGTISANTYQDLLMARGRDKLLNYKVETQFDVSIFDDHPFQFSKDYFLGDVVQIEFGGLSRSARVMEFIYSEDQNGSTSYPTLEVLEDANDG